MRIALYSRCSTNKDQHPENQILDLVGYCKARNFIISEKIIDEGYSGSSNKRPGLTKLLQLARQRKIDAIAVTKLDRLFRSMKHMVTTLAEFDELGITFISIKDNVDLSTSSGRLMMHLISAFAEFERDLIVERTLVGLEHAKARGKKLGRKRSPMYDRVIELRKEGHTYKAIANLLQVSEGIVYRAIKWHHENGNEVAPKSIDISTTEKEGN